MSDNQSNDAEAWEPIPEVFRLVEARAAIAQPAEPAQPDEKCSPDGLRYKLPPLSMTGHQLRQALQFCNDDLDTELHIALRPGGTDTEGEKVEAGLCCWLAEYPEEGSILLDGRSLHDVTAAQADAQPAEPAPEQVSDSPFDQAIHQYAQAAWHHDMAGMRKGYMALQALCSPPAAQAESSGLPRAAQWGTLYTAACGVTAKLGKDGSIQTDDAAVDSLMNALHALDGGQWMPGLMPGPGDWR